MIELESLVKDFLKSHPEVREALELVSMTEQEYTRALTAYEIPLASLPTTRSTSKLEADVCLSGTGWEAGTTARTT